jgi:hypothetical protein
MENRVILKRHRWSIVRKAQVIGALVGALAVPVLVVISNAFNWGDWARWLFLWLGFLLMSPARLLSRGLGWHWEMDNATVAIQLGLVILTNALLCLLLGTLIAWSIQKHNDSKKKSLV